MAALSSRQKRGRQLRLFSWTGAGLVAGVLLLLNFVMSFVPLRLDTSEGQVYSLSKGTKTILKKIDDTLVVRVMFSSDLPPVYKLNEKYVRDLLTEYRRANGKIRVEYFDPGKSNEDRREALTSGVMPVQLVTSERDKKEVKECFMGLALLYGDKRESIPFLQDTQGLEYEITQRLKKLTDAGRSSIGFVTNGGALTTASSSLEALKEPIQQLYDIKNVDLKDPIPADLKALWLIGPQSALDKDAVEKLRQYVKDGGTLGLVLDKRGVSVETFRASALSTGIEDLLKEWGVEFRDGFVYDPRCDRIQVRAIQGGMQWVNIVDYPYFPWVIDLDRENPATKGLDGFAMPFVSPIDIEQEKSGLVYRSLARSSDGSWFDPTPTDVGPLTQKQLPPQVEKGPFNLIMTVDGKFDESAPEPKKGKVILFGSSRFIRSEYSSRPTNLALFMNFIDWSAQDEILLSIRSKGVAPKPLKNLSAGARLLVKYVLMGALPIFSILLGFLIWSREKTRRALLPLRYLEA